MADLDPADYTVDELKDELDTVDDLEVLQTVLEAEIADKDRKTAKEAVERRISAVEAADGEDEDTPTYEEPEDEKAEDVAEDEDDEGEADEEAEEGEETPADEDEEDDGLTRPTADKRHVRALTDGVYRDMWVYCERQAGELVDVSQEMLGKARELMDEYNEEYDADERVVAVLIGDDVERHADDVIACGADLVVYHEDDRLERFRHKPYAEIFCDMARAGSEKEGREPVEWKSYDKPRYVLFPATNNGRDLSAQVQAELDSGLASDCSGLYIERTEISNPVKTGEPGVKKTFDRVLHMKRPDFSGFEYSTILCLDNPNREFHPQGASVIPGSFEVPTPEPDREGEVVEHDLALDDDWFRVAVTEHDALEGGVDLTGHDVVVCLGRGIGRDPTLGMELGLDLVDAFDDAALGITRGIVTSSYQFDGHVEGYAREERQIGETGQVVKPELYIAAGVSGAIQHKVGMDESETIVAINTDPDADIRGFSDYFVEGDLFEVLPRLTTTLQTGELDVGTLTEGDDD